MGKVQREHRIGIIGAGFTGTLLAVHLMRQAQVPTHLFLVERRGDFGRGVAYSTGNDGHLLNVRAFNMSAYPDEPRHFLMWLWARDDPRSPANAIPPSGHAFVSRGLYGTYVQEQFAAAVRDASGHVTCSTLGDDVVDLRRRPEGGFVLRLACDSELEVDTVALCIGNFPPALPGGVCGEGAGNPFYITGASPSELQKLATELGVNFEAAPASVSVNGAVKLRRPRIGLADVYGGSISSGWTRFVLEQFEFPFEVIYPKVVDAANLASRFDVLIFPSDVGPAPAAGGRGGGRGGVTPAPNIPAEFEPTVGSYTAEQTGPALKKFLEDGGTILAVGRSSMNVARVLGLPVENHLVERSADGSVTQIPVEKYYVPGSILRIAVDNSAPLAQGMEDHVDVFFDNSPVFTLGPEAVRKGLRPIAWFDTPTPLRSGWAFGQGYVNGGVEIVQATVGKGNLFMFGPEITFRAQPHGTFKFLFNGLYLGAASSAVGSSTNSQASR